MDYTDCNDFLWPIEIFGLKQEKEAALINRSENLNMQKVIRNPLIIVMIPLI
jgi:hypothetical protein